jgi:hypothetical protein
VVDEADRVGEIIAELAIDHFQHTIQILIHFAIPESQDSKFLTFELRITNLVLFGVRGSSELPAIDFND